MITYSVPFGKDERALMIRWHQNVGFLYTMKKQFDEYFLETKNVKDLDQVKARELDKDRQVPNERQAKICIYHKGKVYYRDQRKR